MTSAPLRFGAREQGARELIELPLEDQRWRELVAGAAGALPFHTDAWGGLLADCYGFRGFGLALAGADGRLTAGLPIVETTRPVGRGCRWISLPFTDYCPPLLAARRADDDLEQLLAAADATRAERGIPRLELRAPAPSGAMATVGFRHVLQLDRDAEAVWKRFKKTRVQQLLLKADRDAVIRIRRADDAADVDDVFYRLHLATRRRLGVPVQPRRFFRLLWERMLEPGHGWALVAEAERVPVAAAIFLSHRDTVVYKFSASDRSSQRLHAPHVLLWHAIRESCERGFAAFDFGRTDPWSAGLRTFKLGWGPDEETLRYTRLGDGWSAEAPGAPGRASELLAAALRRSPAFVTRATGELLYRYAA